MDDESGIGLLKAKVGSSAIYAEIEPRETRRSFFNGAEVVDALVDSVRPKLIVEVGTWMGHSAIHMAGRASRLDGDALVVCIDTWLGSSEHYFNDAYLADLDLRNGRPDFYRHFLSNVVFHGMQDSVLPLSISSHAGFEILQKLNVTADLIYIDAGHGYDDVRGDLRDFRKLLSPSGAIFGDDYFYPPVKRAVDDYAGHHGLHVASYGDRGHKWVLVQSREDADRLVPGVALVGYV